MVENNTNLEKKSKETCDVHKLYESCTSTNREAGIACPQTAALRSLAAHPFGGGGRRRFLYYLKRPMNSARVTAYKTNDDDGASGNKEFLNTSLVPFTSRPHDVYIMQCYYYYRRHCHRRLLTSPPPSLLLFTSLLQQTHPRPPHSTDNVSRPGKPRVAVYRSPRPRAISGE